MKNNNPETDANTADLSSQQPFFYEIRVKSRLSEEQWLSWFDHLTITAAKGETILRGSLPDHSALYGLLARLRDLAIPLLALKVLDAEAWQKLNAQYKRLDFLTNLILLFIYLAIGGALASMTVFLTTDGSLDIGLGLAILCAALGAIAFGFFLWSGKIIWRRVAYLLLPTSILIFLVFVAITELIPLELALGILSFYIAGILVFLLYYLRGRTAKLDHQITEWTSVSSDAEPDHESQPATDDDQDDLDH